jgi:uncharacterized protein (TIGR02594 family)
MATSSYDEAISRLLVHEGGYSDHPQDPGGPTNHGITLADYRRFVRASGTAADVRGMNVATAKAIYRSKYWAALSCDSLPAGIDYAIFDYGVNSGIGRAARVLQELCSVAANGAIGAATLAAAHARDPKALVAAICDERLAFLQSLSTWPTFGRGWGRRVVEVRAAALAMAGRAQGVVAPISPPPAIAGEPPWLARMTAILGLYERAGAADNPAILAMAKACGGKIAREYKHDATPWCALAVNWALAASGIDGNDSLWALDFRKYGKLLRGPAVGAIATKTREGGGHVFLVVGRTLNGSIVGRGGNQADMVCDQIFDAGECRFNWPAEYPSTAVTTLAALPVVAPASNARREVALPPPSAGAGTTKSEIRPPKVEKPIAGAAAAGAAVAAGARWDWISEYPVAAALIALAVLLIAGAAVVALRARARSRQQAPMPVVPVGAAAPERRP